MTFEIVFQYQNNYDATLDHSGSVTISAASRELALEEFEEDYGSEYHILCVVQH